MILDVMGISRQEGLSAIGYHEENSDDLEELADRQSYLVVSNVPGNYFAVPLGIVRRIEQVNASRIEDKVGRPGLQYEDRSLPLISLSQLPEVPKEDGETQFVLVFRTQGHEIGLVVNDLMDAHEASTIVDDKTFAQKGIMGSIIIEGHTVLLVDLYELAKQRYPEWTDTTQMKKSEGDAPVSVLVVDDSSFYRNQISRFVSELGAEVVTAEDGEIGLQKLQSQENKFDIVLTDIEMPNLDGLGFMRAIRGDPNLQSLPVIAITSLAGTDNEEMVMQAGADKYMVKLAKDELQSTLVQLSSKLKRKAVSKEEG
ncbi:MAG: hypothetical protein CMO81_05590 [Waddliaceae bacterium]|nr:hypothetical protein [Waddliaceae bacterium]